MSDGERIGEVFRLRPGVFLGRSPSGDLHLLRRELWGHIGRFCRAGPSERALLDRLSYGMAASDLLAARKTGPGVDELVDAVLAGGWVVTTITLDDRPLYSLEPVRGQLEHDSPEGSVVLSRFAVVHRDRGEFVVESPRANANVRLHDVGLMAILPVLEEPFESPSDGVPPWPAAIVLRLRQDLVATGQLVAPDAEERSTRLRQWQPHELWFHSRSRRGHGGYSDGGFGRTSWGKDFEQVPTQPAARPGPLIDLYRPDLSALRRADVTLTSAIEDRRSIREHDAARPVTRDEIGEFLFRTSRVRRTFHRDGVEHVSRPFPSGGSVYELELYLAVGSARDLAAGVYHYDSFAHGLRLVRAADQAVTRLLWTAKNATESQAPPQVLIIVTSRFGRLMLSYEEIAYSLILKHVGVLFQTFSLVATAMGLASCAMGAGATEVFADVAELDEMTEAAVGEFALGSRPDEA